MSESIYFHISAHNVGKGSIWNGHWIITIEYIGYWCLENGKFEEYLEMNDLSKYVSKALLSLLTQLLSTNEVDRLQAHQVIQHRWFNGYHRKYASRIRVKSEAIRQTFGSRRKEMSLAHFPFYEVNKQHKARSPPIGVPYSKWAIPTTGSPPVIEYLNDWIELDHCWHRENLVVEFAGCCTIGIVAVLDTKRELKW